MAKKKLEISIADVLKIHQNLRGSPEAYGILLVNLLLLFFVIFFREQRYLVVAAYFMETLIIGIFNIIKMLIISIFNPGQGTKASSSKQKITAKSRLSSLGSGLFFIIFFIFHFGLFYFVQLTFVAGMVGSWSGSGIGSSSFFPNPVTFFKSTLGEEGLLIFLSIVLYQLFSLFYSFLFKKEYAKRSCVVQGMQPYGRILIQQFVVLIGGFFIIILNGALVLSILLVVIKTFVDIYAQKNMNTAMLERMAEENYTFKND